ncbi:hypothetical protein D3C72_2303630 [compost metagenome]
MPMAWSTRIDTRLRDLYRASRRRIGPRKVLLSFFGRQASSIPASWKTMGASLTRLAAVKPLSSAAL